jgi:hypothetical protein
VQQHDIGLSNYKYGRPSHFLLPLPHRTTSIGHKFSHATSFLFPESNQRPSSTFTLLVQFPEVWEPRAVVYDSEERRLIAAMLCDQTPGFTEEERLDSPHPDDKRPWSIFVEFGKPCVRKVSAQRRMGRGE